ncbi:MAG: Gldg family protein [Pseudomonadota bacterium]
MPNAFNTPIAALVALLLLSGPAVSQTLPVEAAAQNESPVQEGLTPDATVVRGILDNGLRYAILQNDTPSGSGALWMRLDVGSLAEEEDQRGLAHFLEHMAFNGSDNVPEGEMVRILERHGLAFGADNNAYTSLDETVYLLDLPNLEVETLNAAFFLFRETAGRLSIEPGAVERERGVILSEERASDTPGFRAQVAQMEFFFPDSMLAERLPIGTVEVINEAPAARIRDLYEDYYRPDRAFVVFVGDAAPSDIEARIEETFADWEPARAEYKEPDTGSVDPDRQTEAGYFYNPDISTSVTIAGIKSAANVSDSPQARRAELLRAIGNDILGRRLARLARQPDAVVLSAHSSFTEMYDVADVATVIVGSTFENWESALVVAETELRRAREHGFTESELAEALANWGNRYESLAERAATRPNSMLAQAITAAFAADRVFTHPTFDLALFEAAAPTITAEAVTEAFRAQWNGVEPLVHLASSGPVDNAEAAILAAFETSRARSVAPPEARIAQVFAYDDFGAPGTVVMRDEIADLGITTVRFTNNVRLNVKPTDFEDDVVRVLVRFGGGLLEVPTDLPGLGVLAANTLVAGGLGSHSQDELQTILAGRSVSRRFEIEEDAFVLTGVTKPDDVALLLQLFTASLTDPGYRDEAFARFSQSVSATYDTIDATPAGVYGMEGPRILRNGDSRFGLATKEALTARTREQVQAMLARAFQEGAIEIGIVPLLTMGLISREKHNGSIRLLMSSPLTISEIVAGKYLAILTYLLIFAAFALGLIGLSGVLVPHFDYGLALSGLLGMVLLAATYAAVGLFLSSLTNHQIVAAISMIALLAALSFLGTVGQRVPVLDDVAYWLSIAGRAGFMQAGLIASKDVLYFIAIIAVCLAFTFLKLSAGRRVESQWTRAGKYVGVAAAALVFGYVTSLPATTYYADMTRVKGMTVSVGSQAALADLEGQLNITTLVNALDPQSWRFLPESRNDLYRHLFERYEREIGRIDIQYQYYYADSENPMLYEANPGKTNEDIAREFAAHNQMNFDSFLTQEEVDAAYGLDVENYRNVYMLEWNEQSSILRNFNDQIYFPLEAEVSAAIGRLIVAPRHVAYVTGHGERNISNIAGEHHRAHMSDVRDRGSLLNHGFEIEEITLDASPPAHIDILVLAAPTEPLGEAALSNLRNYITSGRDLLVLGEPGTAEILNPVLGEIGVTLIDGEVRQAKEDYPDEMILTAFPQAAAPLGFAPPGNNPNGPIVLPGVAALRLTPSGLFRADTILNLADDMSVPDRSATAADVLAVALEREVAGKAQRIVVMGDADFMSTATRSIPDPPRRNNPELVRDIFRYLSDGAYPIDTSRPLSLDKTIALELDDVDGLRLVLFGLLPGLLLLAGGGTLLRRRRR